MKQCRTTRKRQSPATIELAMARPTYCCRGSDSRLVREHSGMTKRYGHIRSETQRRALEAVATEEVRTTVKQIVHQAGSELESELRN